MPTVGIARNPQGHHGCFYVSDNGHVGRQVACPTQPPPDGSPAFWSNFYLQNIGYQEQAPNSTGANSHPPTVPGIDRPPGGVPAGNIPGSSNIGNAGVGGNPMASELGASSLLDTGTDRGDGNLSFLSTPAGQALIQALLGFSTSKLLGGKTSEERDLSRISKAPFGSETIQGFLPLPLRSAFTDPILAQGLAQIADLLRTPGRLPGSVAESIRPQLAEESASIAQNYRNLQSSAAGAGARGNAPISIKNALASALDTQQERAQRQARQEALGRTGELARGDINQTYNLLNSLLQFTSSGRGQAIPGLTAAAQQSGERQAANQALTAGLIKNIADIFLNKGGEDRPKSEDLEF